LDRVQVSRECRQPLILERMNRDEGSATGGRVNKDMSVRVIQVAPVLEAGPYGIAGYVQAVASVETHRETALNHSLIRYLLVPIPRIKKLDLQGRLGILALLRFLHLLESVS
jgi:hypothetical protein